jgi:hypothetical protein
MAYTIQGVGTRFYGKRDFRQDGTYITTEWAVLFHLPLVPLRSLRVRYLGVGRSPSEPGLAPAPLYQVCETTRPNWKQVICVYGYVVSVFYWVIFFASRAGGYTKGLEDKLRAMVVIVGLLWPVIIPGAMRFYARRRFR